MKFIAHRGNLNGPNSDKENKPSYIQKALESGFDVEIDVWYCNKHWYLGHDKPTYKITFKWLFNRHHQLWIHCKHLDALHKLTRRDGKNIWNHNLNYFWHQNDDFTLTSKSQIWTFPRQPLTEFSVCVCPEKFNGPKEQLNKCYGICSDYIIDWKNKL